MHNLQYKYFLINYFHYNFYFFDYLVLFLLIFVNYFAFTGVTLFPTTSEQSVAYANTKSKSIIF